MEAIAKLKNAEKEPTCITFKSTTRLPEVHRLKAANYIIEYMKQGTPHV
jgi:hypothetical protein